MNILNEEQMVCHNHRVTIKYLGSGRFEKIVMYDEEGLALYSVQKEISSLPTEKDYLIKRREYFDNVMRRAYRGWRNSFIEFCREISSLKDFPGLDDYILAMRKLRLSKKTMKIYSEYYEKFFGKR